MAGKSILQASRLISCLRYAVVGTLANRDSSHLWFGPWRAKGHWWQKAAEVLFSNRCVTVAEVNSGTLLYSTLLYMGLRSRSPISYLLPSMFLDCPTLYLRKDPSPMYNHLWYVLNTAYRKQLTRHAVFTFFFYPSVLPSQSLFCQDLTNLSFIPMLQECKLLQDRARSYSFLCTN